MSDRFLLSITDWQSGAVLLLRGRPKDDTVEMLLGATPTSGEVFEAAMTKYGAGELSETCETENQL
jgi:hypothetical protein